MRLVQTIVTTWLLGVAVPAYAGLDIALHQGANDPTTEGFTYMDNFGPASKGPVLNDQGYDAWNITASSLNTQTFYTLSFTSAEDTALATQGFTLSVLARVVSGTEVAPGGNLYPSLDDRIDFGNGRAFDLTAGLNTNGDTVVVLANQYSVGSPNYFVTGPSYTLTGSGSSYHLFQLVYDPSSQAADLFIDGTERISGYTGQNQFFDSGGINFGADNGGSVNYNLVEAQVGTVAVPEPSAFALVCTTAALLGLGRVWRRRLKPMV